MRLQKLLSVELFIFVLIFVLCESLTISFAHCQEYARRWTSEIIDVPAADSSRDVTNLSRYKNKEIYYAQEDLAVAQLKATALVIVNIAGSPDTIKTPIKFIQFGTKIDSIATNTMAKLGCEACDRIVFYTSWGASLSSLRIYKYTDQ